MISGRRVIWLFLAILVLYTTRSVHVAYTAAPTYDEPFHLAGGLVALKFNDYRMQPENGILPQRWLAIPHLLQATSLPPEDHPSWRTSSAWSYGSEFLYQRPGTWHERLFKSRLMNVLLGILTLSTLFCWSFRHLGPAVALLTTLGLSCDPLFLAHSSLATSDLSIGLFAFLSVWAAQRLFDGPTSMRALGLALALGAAITSKYSAILLAPAIAVGALAAIRQDRPIKLRALGRFFILQTMRQKVYGTIALLSVVGLIVIGTIWASYGFRYQAVSASAPAQSHFLMPWSQLRSTSPVSTTLEMARHFQILPEAFLYGFAYVRHFSKGRPVFLDGESNNQGWFRFFPLAFVYKTPLPILTAFALAILISIYQFKRIPWRPATWLSVTFVLTYLLVAIGARLNIGLRHLLPVYPWLFVWMGWAVGRLIKKRYGLVCCLIWIPWTLLDSAWIHPHYLAYFNAPSGGPDSGHLHLVDSSLDWGQGLNELASWMAANPTDQPQYLAYFGTAKPQRHQVHAKRLPSFVDPFEDQVIETLEPGRYIISATMLKPLYLRWGYGEWSADHERNFQNAARNLGSSAIGTSLSNPMLEPQQKAALEAFDQLRFSKLTAYLRTIQADAQVAHVYLVYELDQQDLAKAFPLTSSP